MKKNIDNYFSVNFSPVLQNLKVPSSNTFYLTLQNFLLNRLSTYPSNLRPQQQYHFIAKIITDEKLIDKKEISSNIRVIGQKLKDFINTKSDQIAIELINIYFYCWLLDGLGFHEHFEKLDKKELLEFIRNFNSNDEEALLKNDIFNLYFFKKQKINRYEGKNIQMLSLILLYKQIKIKSSESREKTDLFEYYILQNEIEQNCEILINDNNPLVLEVALILKLITKSGLYIPEHEKFLYISSFAKEVVYDRFISIVAKLFYLERKKIKIPFWISSIIFFLLQFLFIKYGKLIDAISFSGLSLRINLTKLIDSISPIYVIVFNGIFVIIFLFFLPRYIKARIKREL